VTLVLAACLSARVAAAPQDLAAAVKGSTVEVTVAGAPFTAYHFGAELKKPYLWPVMGPRSGKTVTVESIADDHPHHNSIWLGCDRVNGQNFWQPHGDLAGGQIRSTGVTLVQPAGPQVHFTDTCIWQKPGAEPVIRDVRQIRVAAPSPDLRLIDVDVTLEMLVDVTIEKNNHSLFSVRMVPELSVTSGGTLVNAGRLAGEKGTFGIPSSWCDYVGTRGGVVEGVALFDHPQNPWYPSPWFTRDYGFMSPTPMFWPPDGKAFRFAKGTTLPLRYRVVVHAGDTDAARIPALFAQYAPGVEAEPRPGLPTALVAALKKAEFDGSRAAVSQAEAIIRSTPAALRPVLEEQLLGLLQAPDATPEAKRWTCEALAALGSDRSLPALVPLLADAGLAEPARFALARIGSPAALKALREAYPTAAQPMKLAILEALGARRDRDALALLRQEATGDDPDLARASCGALAGLGTPEALGAIAAAAGRAGLRQAVAPALLACAERVAAGGRTEPAAEAYETLRGTDYPEPVRAAATIGLARLRGGQAVPLATELLQASSVVLQGAAAECVAALPPGAEVTAALGAALPGLRPESQAVLAAALGRRGDPAAAGAVRALLDSPVAAVRLAACTALGYIGGPADVALLAPWLDGEAAPREAAAASLGVLAGEGVDAALVQALGVLRQPGGRTAWVRVIQERGGPLPVDAMLALALDPERSLREAALRAVADLGGEAEIARLVAVLERGLATGVETKPFEQALASLCRRSAGKGEATRFCVAALPTAQPPARASLVAVLGSLADESGLPLVVAATKDPDEGVRDAGVRALSAWPRFTAFAALVDAARAASSLPHNVLALRGCRRLLEAARNELGDEDLQRHCQEAIAAARRDEERKLFDMKAIGVLIKDLKVSSKGTYAIHRGAMAEGAKWASDRAYTFTQVPAEVLGATYIEVTMNDRGASAPAEFVTFSAGEPVTVYVAYDHRCTALPEWLRSWEKTAAILDSTAVKSHLVLYRKAFPAGRVALGPCAAPGVAAMYSVCATAAP